LQGGIGHFQRFQAGQTRRCDEKQILYSFPAVPLPENLVLVGNRERGIDLQLDVEKSVSDLPIGQSLDFRVSNLVAILVKSGSRKVKVEFKVGKVCDGKQLLKFGNWCLQHQSPEALIESGPCVIQECLDILGQRSTLDIPLIAEIIALITHLEE